MKLAYQLSTRYCSWRHTGFLVLALGLTLGTARAQKSSLLQITELLIPPGELLQVSFTDLGTGATNYVLQGSPALGESANWAKVAGSLVLSQGNGNYQAIAPSPTFPLAFYRILAQGGLSGPVTATFAASDIRIVEGTALAPTVTFSAPYAGLLRYTLSGATSTGDPIAQSGTVMVNGTSATIPLNLIDDAVVGALSFLTLTIEASPNLILGGIVQTLITIDENDAIWKGSLSLDGAELGFSLLIDEVDGVKSAQLQGDGTGFFGSINAPASLVFSAETFTCTVTDVLLPPEDSYLHVATRLTLRLEATNGNPGQGVGSQLVQGVGELVSEVLGHSHLNRTNQGPFTLLKSPVAPSPSQVALSDSPPSSGN